MIKLIGSVTKVVHRLDGFIFIQKTDARLQNLHFPLGQNCDLIEKLVTLFKTLVDPFLPAKANGGSVTFFNAEEAKKSISVFDQQQIAFIVCATT